MLTRCVGNRYYSLLQVLPTARTSTTLSIQSYSMMSSLYLSAHKGRQTARASARVYRGAFSVFVWVLRGVSLWLNPAMGYIRSSLASKWSLPVTFSHFALSAGQNMWVRTSSLTPASLGIPVHPQALNMTASARLAKVSTGRVYFYACTRIGDCQHSVS